MTACSVWNQNVSHSVWIRAFNTKDFRVRKKVGNTRKETGCGHRFAWGKVRKRRSECVVFLIEVFSEVPLKTVNTNSVPAQCCTPSQSQSRTCSLFTFYVFHLISPHYLMLLYNYGAFSFYFFALFLKLNGSLSNFYSTPCRWRLWWYFPLDITILEFHKVKEFHKLPLLWTLMHWNIKRRDIKLIHMCSVGAHNLNTERSTRMQEH